MIWHSVIFYLALCRWHIRAPAVRLAGAPWIMCVCKTTQEMGWSTPDDKTTAPAALALKCTNHSIYTCVPAAPRKRCVSCCFVFSYFQTWATLTHDLIAFHLLVIQPAAVFPFNFCFCQPKRALWEKWVTLFAFGVIAVIMGNYHSAPNTQTCSRTSPQCSPLHFALWCWCLVTIN